MVYSKEVENMCVVAQGPNHGPAPIPEEGRWVRPYQIADISGKEVCWDELYKEKEVNHE